MATYVMGDIHGEYDKFMELLEKIDLKDTDTLYLIGDVIDRGPHPVKVLLKLMEMPNAIPILGNHELMALQCMKYLMKEITDQNIEELDSEAINDLLIWQGNGSMTTTDEFRRLDRERQQEVYDYLRDFLVYEELEVNGQKYLLVHAGLGNFSPEKEMEDYSLMELVWDRADFEEQYFDDVYVVSGHTPTQLIEENPKPGYIYRANNHIAIDCGSCFKGGRLAAICLDTGEEFYSSENDGSE
ncbi:MAG: serine/threonine protein phosphatase [Lachnospiraceae bacterium]|nr:serine/threonine protein phosphatase [Lachnospiraceae bacterium]